MRKPRSREDKLFTLGYRASELQNGESGNLSSTSVSKAHFLKQYNLWSLSPVCEIWKSDNMRSSNKQGFHGGGIQLTS